MLSEYWIFDYILKKSRFFLENTIRDSRTKDFLEKWKSVFWKMKITLTRVPLFFEKKKWNTLLSSQFLCGKSHKMNYNSREKSKSWNYFEIFENLNHTALVDSSIQKGRIKMVNGNTGATAGYLVPAFDFFDEKRLWEQFKEKKKGYSDRCHIDDILVVIFCPEITLL